MKNFNTLCTDQTENNSKKPFYQDDVLMPICVERANNLEDQIYFGNAGYITAYYGIYKRWIFADERQQRGANLFIRLTAAGQNLPFICG